ncbi:acetylcholine receptor subunit alpha-like [Haliotis rubra]|uniref:acetylcholine receptor subunit alpha-like n=1 Tax=Haliotis rubra TaxID=36100 RepID=UPI001EE56B7E|nr:acetylcholine receptor subunit alpha-like [Haliotis rubra]
MFDHYSVKTRPIFNQSEIVVAKLSVKTRYIVNLDEVLQQISLLATISVEWKDNFLVWNTSKYGGISRLHPKTNEVWLPKLYLVDGLPSDQTTNIESGFSCTVDSMGQLRVRRDVFIQSFCPVSISKFPFDVQVCHLDFQPRDYMTDEFDLTFDPNDRSPLSVKLKHGEWDLVSAKYQKPVASHPSGVVRQRIRLSLTLRRLPLFFLLNIIIPINVISILNILVFVIPPSTGEKLSVSVTGLLALAVFLSYISSLIPNSSEDPSLLLIYISILLVFSSLSILGSVIVSNAYHTPDSVAVHPRLVRMVQASKGRNATRQSGILTARNHKNKLKPTNASRGDKIGNTDTTCIATTNASQSSIDEFRGADTLGSGTVKVVDVNGKVNDGHVSWKDVSCFLDNVFFWLTLVSIISVDCAFYLFMTN